VTWHSAGSKDGVRMDGETLAEMHERFGKADMVPEEPDVPECVGHVLAWFFDLSKRRQPGMAGVSPLTPGDIAAWRDLLGILIEPFEVRMILDLDDAYRSAANELHKKDGATEAPPPKGFFGK
jgi:hypothetical protein